MIELDARPHRRRAAAGLVAVGLAIGLVVGYAIGRVRRGTSTTAVHSARPATTTTSAPHLKGGAAALVDLIHAESGSSFHAQYTVTEPGQPAGSTLSLELWRASNMARQDTQVVNGGMTQHETAFDLPSGVVVCAQTNAQPWQCHRTAQGRVPTLDEQLAALISGLSGAVVVERDDVIAGVPGRCFAIANSGTTSTVCLTPLGVPLRLESSGSTLLATMVSVDVASDAFTPPATPSG